MDPIIYLKLLSPAELEVEYLVREIPSKTVDSNEKLVNRLRAEQLDRSIICKNSHVKDNPERELKDCSERYLELSKVTEEQGDSPSLEFVTLAYVKARHYKERIFRLINTVGETTNVSNIYRNWRHIFNVYHKLWNEFQDSDKCDHSPRRITFDTSSFSEKLDKMISIDYLNTSETGGQHLQPSTSAQARAMDKIQRIPVTEPKHLKPVVAEFFTKMGANHRANSQGQGNISSTFLPSSPNGLNMNNASHQSEQHENDVHFSRDRLPQQNKQNIQYRLDNFYKIRQKWNLSFDGTELLNIHDFIYRLEQMAMDDGIPTELLPKVLHLFLIKKAQDWYWVYKTEHPNATWLNMKHSMLSYFSSSNYEEEIKEQILRRYQSPRESFSDFSLTIQKMNARLQTRLSENQIIYRLCQNMYPALKNVTLPYHNKIHTVDELRILCRDYEKLWEQSGYDPRRFGDAAMKRRPQINELSIDMNNLRVNQIPTSSNISHDNYLEDRNIELLEAFHKIPNDRKEGVIKHDRKEGVIKQQEEECHLICWNCQDIGHSYHNCREPILSVFCFGCGEPNVRKPNCQNCLKYSGNVQPSANYMRGLRLGTQMRQIPEHMNSNKM